MYVQPLAPAWPPKSHFANSETSMRGELVFRAQKIQFSTALSALAGGRLMMLSGLLLCWYCFAALYCAASSATLVGKLYRSMHTICWPVWWIEETSRKVNGNQWCIGIPQQIANGCSNKQASSNTDFANRKPLHSICGVDCIFSLRMPLVDNNQNVRLAIAGFEMEQNWSIHVPTHMLTIYYYLSSAREASEMVSSASFPCSKQLRYIFVCYIFFMHIRIKWKIIYDAIPKNWY